ncbi:hypothetical protein AMECASPLE_008272 [Ameca splendens]|uniref:Secreted protein n=1 Tax=Ameca splendens TaxID=208324 RepID=A0ABV0YBR8_9TELE
MRNELGSCTPGSFTAVVLFYIYGAAAGPAVARCESHDSSAGNRDGPVILAPHRLHVTPALLALLLDAQHSPQDQTEDPHRHASCMQAHSPPVLFPVRTLQPLCFSRTSPLFGSVHFVSMSDSVNPPSSFYLSF